MNNAKLKQQAAESVAQLIAKLDKPSNSAIAKAPTVVRPRLEYIEFFEKHTRAAYNVAQVYSFLVFRCQRNKPGDASARLEVIREGGRWGERAFWYLHTPEDIARECGKRVAKIESALKILKRLKMIDARAGRHPVNGNVIKYRGKTVTHIRLGVCARGNGLDAWPTVEQMSQMRIIPGIAEAVLISSAEAVLLLQDAVVDLDSLEVLESNKSPAEKNSSGATQFSISTGKDTNQNKPTPVPPDAVVKSENFSKVVTTKEKTKLAMVKQAKYTKNTNPVLPAGESTTSVCPNNDRLLAEGHDLQHLLNLCQASRFAGANWKMIPDGHAGKLLEVKELLAKHNVTNSLESILELFGNDPCNRLSGVCTGWDVLRYVRGDYAVCHPNLPSLPGKLKRFLEFLEVDGPLKSIEFRRVESHVWFDTDSSGHPHKWDEPSLSIMMTCDDCMFEARTEYTDLVVFDEGAAALNELKYL